MGSCATRGAIDIQPAALVDGYLGVTYRADIDFVGNDTPISHSGILSGRLPQGLQLLYSDRESRAHIEGIPLEAGVFEFVLGVSGLGTQCAGQQGERAYRLRIVGPDESNG